MSLKWLVPCAAALGLFSTAATAAIIEPISGVMTYAEMHRNLNYEYVRTDYDDTLLPGYGYHEGHLAYSWAGPHRQTAEVQSTFLKLDGTAFGFSTDYEYFTAEINFTISERSIWNLLIYGGDSIGERSGVVTLKDSNGVKVAGSWANFNWYVNANSCTWQVEYCNQTVVLDPGLYTMVLDFQAGGQRGSQIESHVLLSLVEVPLPAAAPLLGMGLMGLAGLAARRRKSA